GRWRRDDVRCGHRPAGRDFERTPVRLGRSDCCRARRPSGWRVSPRGDAQDAVPYLQALHDFADRGARRYHVPGHKGQGDGSSLSKRLIEALPIDLPSAIDGIDIGERPTPLERAEELAAGAWGAARTWFLVNGASEGNHVACLALA